MKKNVLFINRNFYEYDKAIEKMLIKQGCNVLSYSISPANNIFVSIISKFCKELIYKQALKQQKRMIVDLTKQIQNIDVVFVLAGQLLEKETLDALHELYPKARFVWYLWDNIINVKEYVQNRSSFDVICSFDFLEAKNESLFYIPLFYIDRKVENKIYQISFIGHAHSNRKEIIQSITNKVNFESSFFYLLTGWYTKIKYIFNKKMNRYLFLRALPYKKVIDVTAKSKCVLDLPQPNQTGLTMRTFEALGANSKLITTNSMIKEYDFYNSNNIYIIDTQNIIMPDKDFFDAPYEDIEECILNEYSLESWTKKLLKLFE